MKKISLSFAIAAASFAVVLPPAPAHAQASRTWVSGVGDDVNPCSRTAPCKTFAGAISKTALNGEINCLDPGGFGAVTITKSITIDCHEALGSILFSGTNGINIPFNSFNAADVRKTVRLRNLNLNGVDTGIIGIRITGGSVIAAGVVIIELSAVWQTASPMSARPAASSTSPIRRCATRATSASPSIRRPRGSASTR